MNMISVRSPNISSVGYDNGDCHIVFNNGKCFCYKDVPREKFNGLIDASSVGIYLNREFKGVYRYERLSDKDVDIEKSLEGRVVIRFDGPPGPESGRFVEVERDGKSINFGEWVKDGDYWLLVIPEHQIKEP